VRESEAPGSHVDDHEDAVDDVAQRMRFREPEVALRIEKCVDGRRDGAAAAVTEHHDELHRPGEVIGGVTQAAEPFGAEAVAGNAHDEEIVGAFVEEELHGNARVGASEDGGERALRRPPGFSARHADVARIEMDLAPGDAASLRFGDQRRDRPAALGEPRPGLFGIGRPRASRVDVAVVAIRDLDGHFTP
jgi:hypothetical protein